ncbi:MAG: hypothetical protein K6B13_08170 [Prevotella sp.]|nr:hypothetical protein [Prevotella sp.]
MKKQNIIDTVNAIVADKAGVDACGIMPNDFCDELCADSIQCLEALLEIEEELCINIQSKELPYTPTMQQVYDIVEQAIVNTHGFDVH